MSLHDLGVVLGTVAACLALLFLLILVLSGGSLARIALAMRCEMKALLDPAFGEKVKPLLGPATPKPPPKPSGEPLRLLALLQREGRLLDFLLEDIQSY